VVRIPAVLRDSSVLHSAPTGYGIHPASYPVDVGVNLVGGVKVTTPN
jgi:hypothetical protein